MTNTLLLLGVVGSTAYGLAGPDSDVDRLGMYAAPTVEFHGLRPPVGKAATIVRNDPDETLHEAGKFASLALSGNPTVMELLWLTDYEVDHPLGLELVDIRSAFLCAPRVRDAYLGYATQQFKRLDERGDNFGSDLRKRTAKHARHLMRLCYQGLTLYRTGELVVRLSEPEAFLEFGERVAEQGSGLALKMVRSYEDAFNGTTSVLPDRPDEAKVEAWLKEVRRAHYRV